MVAIDDVRALALTLPRSYEAHVRGRVKFRVGRIVFASFSRDGSVMGFGFPKEWRDALVESEPGKFSLPSAHDLRYNWVHVRLAAIEADEMRELVEGAWAMCVPKRVAAAYAASKAGPRPTDVGARAPSGRLGGVPATVVVGAQWGDEGKGKIVDLLAQQARCGLPLPGRAERRAHDRRRRARRSRSARPRAASSPARSRVIGGGCVVDPEVLIAELDDLEARGIDTSVVVLSGNAHLIMPWHIAIDQASERRLGKLQIGTTRRGIGPCYADKASRIGIRVQDVLDPKILRQKIEVALAEKNVWLERVYEVDGFDLDEVAARYEGYAQAAAPDRRRRLAARRRGAHATGKDVLFEGAQATLLDLDHGTYPFVTSSNPIASGRRDRHRHRPDPDRPRARRRQGVRHPRRRRAVPVRDRGPGPGAAARARRRVRHGHRPRRAAAAGSTSSRCATPCASTGSTSLALTKLDVLSDFAELPVCVRYRLRDGTETPHFPAHQSDFHHAEPVWETLPGWREPLDGADRRDELPDAARGYVEFVERELGIPVELVGVGAARERVLV